MFPTLIRIGSFHIATYGALVAAAYLAVIFWLKSQHESMKLTEERFWTMIYFQFFGALAGGKLFFILLNWPMFASDPIRIIRDFRYGFVYFGGFLGSILMSFVYFRGRVSEVARVSDYYGAIVPVGHAIGRLGCLAAGCCFGRPTTLPWGVRFTDPDSLVAINLLGVPIHPTQLYESLGNLIIAFFLFRLLKKTRNGKLRSGGVFCAYILLYSILRFIVEFYRGDDRGGFLYGLSPSQWIAVGAGIATVVIAAQAKLWQKKSA